MDASDLDDSSVRILTALTNRPGKIWAVEDLCKFLGEDPVNIDRALQLLARHSRVAHYWIPTVPRAGSQRRRYVELAERGARATTQLPSGARRRGVVGTFLWEGSDAAKIAWSARQSQNRSREIFQSRRKSDAGLTAYYEPEGIFSILRHDGWAAAYGALIERRRARQQQRLTRPR